MRRRCTTGLHRFASATVVAMMLVACTSQRAAPAPSTSSAAVSSDAAAPTTPREAHPTREVLAAALPTVADLSWLPPGSVAVPDANLTDRLVFVGCSAAPHEVESNRASATNVEFRDIDAGGSPIAVITFHDVASADEAAQFMAGMRAFLRCPNQGASASAALLPLGTPTVCDDTLALRTTHAGGATVDAWCRVGNLIGRIHLEPRLGLDATLAQAVETINAVGTRLGALVA